MIASAWLEGEEATPDEQADLAALLLWEKDMSNPAPTRRTFTGTLQPHWSPNAGSLFITTGIEGGSFTGTYQEQARAAIDKLFLADPRMAEGKFYKIEVC